MKEFKKYLNEGLVIKQRPNINRAKSLIEEAVQKKSFLDITIKMIPKEKWNPNVICEQCYDIIIELIRAKMIVKGYNSSSHEAEVSYLKILEFNDTDIKMMDELRYYRNGTKYYGTLLNVEYTEKILTFLKKHYKRLLNLAKEF
jgi:hypothetical protein